ncbi:MAG TPA: pentapeptide repeat-containing protein [Streptosporangiaceae bacterium]
MSDRPGLPERRRLELRADCERCAGLCCAAPAFSVSADFAISKPAGQPCPNLTAGFRCSIHDRLRPAGFGGCAAFDCFGAGQKVVQETFSGRDWRQQRELSAPMFAAFAVMRQLHELLWYVVEALALSPSDPLPGELDKAFSDTERLTHSSPDELIGLDVDAHRQRVNGVLLRVSEQVRERAASSGPAGRRPVAARNDRRRADLAGADLHGAGLAGADLHGADLAGSDLHGADLAGADLRGADLAGADLAGADLTGACLRGALLIGADLRRAKLSYADLTGADLRGALLAGTGLASAIFLTQAQLDSAKGDSRTSVPASLRRPPHWP